jgi:hypothetical protein
MGLAVYVIVALIWFIPDRRIEGHVGEAPDTGAGLK